MLSLGILAANVVGDGLLKVGNGPQSNAAAGVGENPGVLFKGTEPCFLVPLPAPLLPGRVGDGLKWSSGSVQSPNGISGVDGGENNAPLRGVWNAKLAEEETF